MLMKKLILTTVFGLLLTSCDRESLDSAVDLGRDNEVVGKSTLDLPEVDPDEMACGSDEFLTEANITVLEAAKIYEKHSGKRVIIANELAEKIVSFTLGGPLTNSDLAKFLQLALLAEGYAIIPIPGEEGIVRIVDSLPVNTLGSRLPNPRWFDEDELPEGDDIIMFVMKLEKMRPEAALEVFQSELGAQTESGTIAAVPNETILIITEPTSLIRKMLEIKERIDVTESEGG